MVVRWVGAMTMGVRIGVKRIGAKRIGVTRIGAALKFDVVSKFHEFLKNLVVSKLPRILKFLQFVEFLEIRSLNS